MSIVLYLLLQHYSHAALDACTVYVDTSYSPGPDVANVELRSSGVVLDRKFIPKENVYIYVIDHRHVVWISARVPEIQGKAPAKYLASHRSIVNRIIQFTGDTGPYLAAGEIHFATPELFGIEVTRVTNRSGSLRSSGEILRKVIMVLQAKQPGIPWMAAHLQPFREGQRYPFSLLPIEQAHASFRVRSETNLSQHSSRLRSLASKIRTLRENGDPDLNSWDPYRSFFLARGATPEEAHMYTAIFNSVAESGIETTVYQFGVLANPNYWPLPLQLALDRLGTLL